MRVLIVARGPDTAGIAIGLKHAFDAVGMGWKARAVRRRMTRNWLQYPADLEWNSTNRATVTVIQRLAAEADVIHVMQTPTAFARFEGWQRKRRLVSHLGSYFRDRPEAVSAACRRYGAQEVVISHELRRFAPHAPIVPNPVDVNRLAAMRLPRAGRSVRIVHAPTDRAVKSTAAFLAACKRLSSRYRIAVDLIERMPWSDCLERKARADILFDQVRLGYGMNAVEAWAMGIPVVAGLADPVATEWLRQDAGELPYVEATEQTIADALEPLIAEASLRHEWGERGRAFVERFHSQRAVVERLVRLYESRTAVAA